MRRRFTLSLLALFLLFFACKKHHPSKMADCMDAIPETSPIEQSICQSELCNQYTAIWKELFMAQNQFSETFFENHITIMRTSTDDWNDGTSFGVFYIYHAGWASATVSDQFIIKIREDNHAYPSPNLPRAQYLDKQQINFALQNQAFSSHIARISNSDQLLFKSSDHALKYLIKEANVDKLCYATISINKTTGNLTLSAGARYVGKENSCISASVDLLSRVTSTSDGPCFISSR